MKKTTVTVEMTGGTLRRLTLPEPVWSGDICPSNNIGTGLYREAVYIGQRSGRVVVQTYSQWQSGNSGHSVGTRYHEADDQEIAQLARDLPELADKLDALRAPEVC